MVISRPPIFLATADDYCSISSKLISHFSLPQPEDSFQLLRQTAMTRIFYRREEISFITMCSCCSRHPRDATTDDPLCGDDSIPSLCVTILNPDFLTLSIFDSESFRDVTPAEPFKSKKSKVETYSSFDFRKLSSFFSSLTLSQTALP